MDATIRPSALTGSVPAVASKSMAHRLLILAALSTEPVEVVVNTTSADIEATRACLADLAGKGATTCGGTVYGLPSLPSSNNPFSTAKLDVGESGSTLRFLLPILGALDRGACIERHGRLTQRPLAPFDDELRAHGMTIVEVGDALLAGGALHGGTFALPGDVSSQFVSGLLMAAPLLDAPTQVLVAKPVQSRPYVELTIAALAQFGVAVTTRDAERDDVAYEAFLVEPQPLQAQSPLVVEGDWSNAAFWLAAGALEAQGLTVSGLDLASAQGDRTVLAALAALGARIARKGDAARATRDNPRAATLDVSSIPDLVPPLAAVAATTPGTTRLTNAGRLRLKESDRLEAITHAIQAMGGRASVAGDDLVIEGVAQLVGGKVEAANDHRIAMMAAVMATHATGTTIVRGAECVEKSYPAFWDDYARLGGLVTCDPAGTPAGARTAKEAR